MLQSEDVKYTGIIDPTCAPVEDTDMIDPTCDVVLGFLLFLSGGFSIHPDDKAAIALEVLINKATSNFNKPIHCTYEDMEMFAKVVNIMMLDGKGSPKDPKKTLEFLRRCERARQAVIETTGTPATEQQAFRLFR